MVRVKEQRSVSLVDRAFLLCVLAFFQMDGNKEGRQGELSKTDTKR